MSRNRHISSLAKVGKKNKRRQQSREQRVDYQALEPRQLLAADIFADVLTGSFGRTPQVNTPNQHGAVGPDHIVEVTNGQFRVFDKLTHTEVLSKDMDLFWLDFNDTAGTTPGANAGADFINGSPSDSKILYDPDIRRWYLLSRGTGDANTTLPFVQQYAMLAVSRTSNPLQDWTAVTDLTIGKGGLGTSIRRFSPDDVPLAGAARDAGIVANGQRLEMAVDDHNLYITIGNEVLAIDKFNDLAVPTPNMFWVDPEFGLRPVFSHIREFARDAFTGDLILDGNGDPIYIGASAQKVPDAGITQFANDIFGTTAGSIGLTADDLLDPDDPDESTRLLITEITDIDNVDELQFSDPIELTVDAYQAPPDRVRQLFDPDIEVTTGANFVGDTVRVGDSLYAVHSVLSSNGNTSAVRWYEITGLNDGNYAVAQTGTIESEDINYMYPSIAVTPDRNMAITYTSAGLNKFATLTVSLGYENNGVVIMEDPLDLKDGEAGYLDGVGNLWGLYNATVLDPEDPTRVYSFGQWSDDSENGSTQMVGYTMIGHSAQLSGDTNDNTIIVRRSATDATQIEVEIDGVVTNSYEERVLHSITLDGGGGDDTFIVDTTNGEMEFEGGVVFVGDRDDQVEFVTMEHTTFDIAIDGSGTAQVGNDFAAICDPIEDDVRVFNLNFEAGSQWFDATPFDLPGFEDQGYATYGDAYQGELQRYFDEVISPIFAGSFTMTLDITDNETDSLADATALGFGYEEVDGQNLWVASPWSILTGRGDRNGVTEADGRIDYNLDINAFYGGDQQLFLNQLAGGLTRSQFFRVLGMDSNITNHTNFFDPRGDRTDAQVIDTRYVDLNGDPIITGYDGTDNTFLIDNYVTNANWAGDNSGLFFRGVDDFGAEMLLAVNSNSELIDFDVLASALAGTSRNGDFNDIIEEDRAFLRGMGYELNPIVPPVLTDGLLVTFSGIDQLQSGDGNDVFCIRSSNVDFELRGGIGNDTFFVTGLGVGALDLFGEEGDDTYSVVFSPSGVVTIVDSVGSEADVLIGVGTPNDDNFIFNDTGILANFGQMVYVGLEQVSVDGREGDDVFEIQSMSQDLIGIIGGAGTDIFRVNDTLQGTLNMSVVDPLIDPVDQLLIEFTGGSFDGLYTSETVENFEFDGQFVVDTANGVPMNGDGLNLIGDGDDSLTLASDLDTAWVIDGDGAGNFMADIAPAINFMGMAGIVGSSAADAVVVTNTNTDLMFDSRDGADSFEIDNVGLGALTITTGLDDDLVMISNSGGGINLDTGDQDDTVTLMDIGTGLVEIMTGAGIDTLDVISVGAGGLTANMGSEDDDVNIDNAAGIGSIAIQGGDGNDDFEIVDSGAGDILLQGEGGDDTYTLRTIDPTVAVTVDDSIGSEADTLVAFGTTGDDILNVSGTGAGLNGGTAWTISGIETYSIDALAGNDVVSVDLDGTVANQVTIFGGDGDDDMTVDNTGDATLELQGGVGDDNYTVSFGLNTTVNIVDSIGAENDTFTGLGTAFDDTLVINGTTTGINGGSATMVGIENLIVDGFGGDDDITISSIAGNTTVRGGTGMDTFDVSGNLLGGTIEGGSGDDVFNVTATGPVNYFGDAGNDVFNVDQTNGGGVYNGGEDDDTFNIMSIEGTSRFEGAGGFDTFVVTNHLPLGSTGLIDIDGGTGRNMLLVNGYQTMGNTVLVTESQIQGMSAIPVQYAAAGSFNIGNEIGGIELIGSNLENDQIDVRGLLAENSLKMLTGGGNDRFTVRAATRGRILADGQEGSDIYQYAIGSTHSRFLNAQDTGVVGRDRILASLTEGNDNVELSGEAFMVDTDSFGFNENFEAMIVNTRGGNDFVDIRRLNLDFLRVMTGDGNDDVTISNFQGVNKIAVELGADDDDLIVNSGNTSGVLDAEGGLGNDTFTVAQSSFSNATLDGEDGSDTYTIRVADRSQRRIVARDSGTIGTDSIDIVGTVLTDRVTMKVGIVEFANQSILFDENTENAVIDTGAADDIVEIFGYSAANTTVGTNADDDLVFVRSTFGPSPDKSLTVNLGTGDDSAVVNTTEAGTTTQINGDEGNDAIQVGSTFANNNGNLSLLQGSLMFDGGIGNNRMNLNDVGRMASVNYDIGPGIIQTGAGSSSSSMADITFQNTDRVRLDATPFRNHVNVTPSVDTAFSFFGKGGFNTIQLVGTGSGSNQFFGEDGIQGTFKFDNGMRDIYFEDFFVTS